MTTKPWAIYTRVSSDEQAEEGVSLAAQMATCRAYAAERGWTVAHELVDDGYTGRNAKRPGYRQLLKLIEEGAIAGFIVWKLKRLNRNHVNSGLLISLVVKTNIHMVVTAEHWDTTTPTGRAMIGVASIFAQLESEDTGEQTKAAIAYLKGRGYYTGGTVPACCDVIQVDDGKRRRLVAGAGADELRKAWGWVIAGASLLDVAKRLNDAGVPSARRQGAAAGKGWTPSSVRSVLLSPMVTGLLASAEAQQQVRAVLGTRKTPTRRGPDKAPGAKALKPSPLAGLLHCSQCGATYVQITATGNGGAYRWFRCQNRKRGRCDAKDVRCEPVEAEAIAAVAKAMEPAGTYIAEIRAYYTRCAQRLTERQAERIALLSARDQISGRIASLTQQGQIGGAAWAEAMRLLGIELDRTDLRLAQLAGELAAAQVDSVAMEGILSQLSIGAATLPTLPPADQAQALRMLVKAITMHPDRFVIDLYEPLPPVAGGEVRTESHIWGSWRYGARTIQTVISRQPRPSAPTRRAG